MSDLQSIKLLLLEDDNLLTVLERLEFQNIKFEQQGSLLTCGLPPDFASRNNRSVQIKINERLNVAIRNRSDFEGDIYSLVSYVLFNARGTEINGTLFKAKQFICDTLGIDSKGVKQLAKRTDYAQRLKQLSKKANKDNQKPNQIIPEDWLNKYADFYPEPWVEEGIPYAILDMFGIRIDVHTGRIIIPMRNKDGKLIGTKARGHYLPYDKEKKYLYFERTDTSRELYGFWKAKEFIKKQKLVYVFEGEKSVMKCFGYNLKNAVAVSSSNISPAQVDLINSCGKDIQVVIAFDKGSEPEEIKKLADVFPNNDVYAILDTDGLLENKDAPIDKGIRTFIKLAEDYTFSIT